MTGQNFGIQEFDSGVVGRDDMKPIRQKRNEVVDWYEEEGKPCSRTMVGFDEYPASR